jgi:gas vesicle protein
MSDGRGSNINAFLLGTIVGGVLGVLFAPDKGEETRKKIKENYKDWARKALEMAEDLGEGVEPYVEKAAEVVEPVVANVKRVVDQPKPLAEEIGREGEESVAAPSVEGNLPTAKEELERVSDQARVELKKRDQKSRPRFFKGI